MATSKYYFNLGFCISNIALLDKLRIDINSFMIINAAIIMFFFLNLYLGRIFCPQVFFLCCLYPINAAPRVHYSPSSAQVESWASCHKACVTENNAHVVRYRWQMTFKPSRPNHFFQRSICVLLLPLLFPLLHLLNKYNQ